MSLSIPRPQEERASVILPSITCSSCGGSIPLSNLGEHICVGPPAPATAARSQPRPSQIAIPANRPQHPHSSSSSGSWRGPQSISSQSTSSPRPAFACPSSAASSRPAPGNLTIPPVSSGLASGYNSTPRTPSPTNPFFPQAGAAPSAGPSARGLGARREGPYPTDAPLPPGIADTMSGGGAGMAGVGRRAFAAAAWGVRAGVAIASGSGSRSQEQQPPMQSPHPPYHVSPNPSQPRSAGPSQQVLPPWQQPSQPPTSQSARVSPTLREPPLLPQVPLSGRGRSGTISNGNPPNSAIAPPMRSSSAMSHERPTPISPPRRSASAQPDRQPPSSFKEYTHSRKGSASSSTSSSGLHEGVAQLLKARNGESSTPQPGSKLPFFEKYKQMVSSSSGSSADGAALLLGVGTSRDASDGRDAPFTASPEETSFDLDDDDDYGKGSSLPWATPSLAESPVINRRIEEASRPPRHRHPTEGSVGSSHSSMSSTSRSGRYGHHGPESEEVVTPSQSWEGGLAERARGNIVGRRGDEIGEDDEDEEGDQVVFGSDSPRGTTGSTRMPNSNSASTITATNRPYLSTNSKDAHARSRTAPEVRSVSVASNYSDRRRKTCQKCGETVGGSARFVERDGIVLCEKDWKKLYLPSCRRCSLPIEKSAVSSSDGQLKGKWHRACFTCERCEKPFAGDSFYVHGGKPWCQYHYHEENGTLCASNSCKQPIEGPCILTAGSNPERFHPNHLRCDYRGGVSRAQSCREAMDEYYEVDGGRYCERHVGEAQRRNGGSGEGIGGLGRDLKAEKRRTRLVDLPIGGF